MLHIHNGDSSADTARRSTIPGRHFAWREALISGPTPSGYDLDAWIDLRARHLAEAYGADIETCRRDLRAQEELLQNLSEHDEVVLWFEHDLFCQIHLVYLLARITDPDAASTFDSKKLTLVCVDRVEGVDDFRGLGQLTPEQMERLFAERQPVTRAQLTLATKAWSAYTSPDPTEIEALFRSDTSALPFLADAFRLHLARFPSTRDGLGRIENRVLSLIGDGHREFSSLFRAFSDAESRYGYGDLQLWNEMRYLARGEEPLLTIENLDTDSDDALRSTVSKLTTAGADLLAGRQEAVALDGHERWIGGVKLGSKYPIWRWNEEAGTLVLSER